MFKIDTMMKKLSLFILLVMLSSCLWAGSSSAQTNAELQTAIDGGAADIRNFFNTYAGDASGLAGLDPSLVNEALSSVNGGIDNLTSQLSQAQLTNFLDELSELGTLDAADLAGGLLYGISSLDATLGEALTSALGLDFFDDLESIIPGITDLLNTELSSLLGLAGDLEDLISGISSLFGGSGGGVLGTLLSGGGAGALGSLLGGGGGSTALPTASPMSPTCDANILIAMETRAWLEAQREITQNQNLIAKPDSVMEYTCFDSFLNVLALEAENMFSENTSAWSGGSVALISNTDMDNALTELVGNAMNTYITNNFSHSYLGGRGSDDYTPSIPISGAAYTCDQMNRVWMNAKCINFAVRPEDGFLTFDQHASTDPRTLPDPCSAEPKWTPYIEAVFNTPAWRAGYDPNIDTAYTTAADYTEPASCDSSRLIRTGLTIWTEGNDSPDAVCLNPGCFYDGTGCVPY